MDEATTGQHITARQYADALDADADPIRQALLPPRAPGLAVYPAPRSAPAWAQTWEQIEGTYATLEERRQHAAVVLYRLAAAYDLRKTALAPATTPGPENPTTRLVLAGLARGRSLHGIAADLSDTTNRIDRHTIQRLLRGAARELQSPTNDQAAIVHQAYLAGWLANLPTEPRSAHAAEALTPRLRDMLNAIAAGRSNQQIASDIYLSMHTVKTHVIRLFRHLGARNRAHAVALAHQYGHFPRPHPYLSEGRHSMIKATAYDAYNPHPLVILGLSGENMTRLMAGEPIVINLAELGLPPQRVAIVGGRTEEAILAELKTHLGAITTHDTPKAPTP